MEAANDIKSVLLAVGRSRMASLTEQLAALGNTEAEENQKVELQALINDEQDVRQRNKAENILRRHNFFPMILQMTAGTCVLCVCVCVCVCVYAYVYVYVYMYVCVCLPLCPLHSN